MKTKSILLSSLFPNHQKFDALRAFQLPVGQYVIVGNGPLGIRAQCEMDAIELLVSSELWKTLSQKYDVIENQIVFPGGLVKAVEGAITKSEILAGLPFASLLDHAH